MAVVPFDYAQWLQRFPQFGAVPEPTAELYFDEAALYVSNTDASVIPERPRRLILNLLTAHIASLNWQASTNSGGGRISSASEGSVSVAFSNAMPGSAEWYALTPFGIAAWQAMRPYRTVRYFAPSPSEGRNWDWSLGRPR